MLTSQLLVLSSVLRLLHLLVLLSFSSRSSGYLTLLLLPLPLPQPLLLGTAPSAGQAAAGVRWGPRRSWSHTAPHTKEMLRELALHGAGDHDRFH